MSDPAREAISFCFCGPAASGKSTICTALAKSDPLLKLSRSTTTRAMRGSEQDGIEYYFVSEAEFEKRVAGGSFIEHAVYNGKRYGTEKRNVSESAATGSDLLLDIEVEGVKQMKQLYGPAVITVFVFPPSFAALEERLRNRKTEDDEKIRSRLKIARAELSVLTSPGFSDYLLINDDLGQSIWTAEAIVKAERARFSRVKAGAAKAIFE